jgi:hypothetical protein
MGEQPVFIFPKIEEFLLVDGDKFYLVEFMIFQNKLIQWFLHYELQVAFPSVGHPPVTAGSP